jgi:molybdate transport system ATP-binding protein
MSRLLFDCRQQYPGGFRLEAAFAAGDGVTALFGPSGSGKSTVLGLIAGTLHPQRGTIRLEDRTLLDTAARVRVPPERRQIGVVAQDHLLFPHLSVRRNLTFGSRRRPARHIHLERVVEILELGGLLERWPHTLSGGQRQRVALGRALLRGPELLLMDEPLAALDEGLKHRILTYLERAVAEWQIPTLFVSHNPADVRRLAPQVVILEAGQVVAAGPTATTLDPALMTRMKHRPRPVNLLRVSEVRRVDDHWEGKVGDQALHLPATAAPADGSNVYVQFAAHDVALGRTPVEGLSVRNQLRGQVRELVELPDRTFVAVDVGQFLWAEITPEAVRELDIRPGTVIICLVKTSVIEVLWP